VAWAIYPRRPLSHLVTYSDGSGTGPSRRTRLFLLRPPRTFPYVPSNSLKICGARWSAEPQSPSHVIFSLPEAFDRFPCLLFYCLVEFGPRFPLYDRSVSCRHPCTKPLNLGIFLLPPRNHQSPKDILYASFLNVHDFRPTGVMISLWALPRKEVSKVSPFPYPHGPRKRHLKIGFNTLLMLFQVIPSDRYPNLWKTRPSLGDFRDNSRKPPTPAANL